MICSIISSEDKQEFTDVKSITLPAFSGELQILPGHAESFVVLQKGEIVLENNHTKAFSIEAGVCHIKSDIVVIIA